MYLLFVDESGTHGDSHSFVLGALAVHEDDAQRLQTEIDAVVSEKLGRIPPNLDEYELHASEMRNAKKPVADSTKRQSIWAGVDRETRRSILQASYELIAAFEPTDKRLPLAAFGVVVDKRFRPDETKDEREQFAYEVLLNKFDVMLKETRVRESLANRGLVIHDRRVIVERDIQQWTSEWRKSAGNIGQLRNLADVPLFADSRASRLLQVADLVAYALYRRYTPGADGDPGFDAVYPTFHRTGETLHGCVHYTPSFGAGSCECEPCVARLHTEAASRARPAKPRQRRRRRLRREPDENEEQDHSSV